MKNNQKNLLENCQQIADYQKPVDIFSQRDKHRGRIEFRKVKIFNALNEGISLDKEWLEYAEQIVVIERERSVFCTKEKKWKESQETSFYISSISASAKVYFWAIRKHWGIENRNHHVKDVTFEEDKSRIRKNPQIFIKMRSIALNILRKKDVDNVKKELFKNNCNIDKMYRKYSDFF